jgi:hypothetical protein
VTVAIPGCPAQTDAALAPGAETFFACSGGYGGPVLVTSKGGPVLASQRVLYQGSFEESPAVSLGTAASTWQFSWYDAVSPGFGADNLHVLNAGSGATSITAAIPGCSPETAAAVQPGAEAVFACGRGYGGPVSVTSPGSVLAWQRVMYYRSIGDVPGVT